MVSLIQLALAEIQGEGIDAGKWRRILSCLCLDPKLLLLDNPPEVMLNVGAEKKLFMVRKIKNCCIYLKE